MTISEMKMVKPSALNPLGYIIQRQYKDSVVIKNNLFSERLSKARNLYRKDLLAHYGCVNAIEFSEEGELLVSGGDDRRILLWSVAGAIYDKGLPFAMHTTHSSNIFCVAFDAQNKKIFSGGNDDQVLIHETYSGNLKTKIPHRKPVYGLSINRQNDNILATAGDDGRILLFDLRESNQDVQVLAKQKTGFHSVMFNPTNPRFLVTANSEDGIALWDCRKPREKLLYFDSNSGKISGISACFDSTGKKILALRRRLPPVLYATQSENALCQFYHPQYYNSCTMKTCCFAGDNDDYVLSGSDDFNLYMWKIPPDNCEWGSSHVILRGHRSIVNQVRYNKHNNLIASSGVEKMVKLWSAIPIGTWKGSILKEHSDPMRTVYTHEDYISLVGATGERISHDYSDQSTNEDAKMMAFFDSLIQREIEGWVSSSDSSVTSDSDNEMHEDWSKLISHIFRNGRNTSEEPKKHKSNRIAQLISKKKSRLAKMAHNKSSSYIQRCYEKEKIHRKKNFKLKPPPSQKGSGSNKRISKKFLANKEFKPSKYRTRQSVRDFYEQNHTLDAPSTSTGITNSNGLVYRVIEQDSDEETQVINELCNETNIAEENNFVNILPTPLNGTHDMFVNVLETANGSADSTSVRNEEYNHSSSTSHEPRDNNCSSTSSDQQFLQIFSHSTENNQTNGYSESSDSNYEHDYITPVKRRRSVSASDSGCATGPSSSSSYSLRNSRNRQECFINNSMFQDHSSDEEYKYEKFRKQVKKTRVNIIKQIGPDSDSN